MIQLELRLKKRGMSLAAEANREWLDKARDLAKAIAGAHGEITIDDIRDRWLYPVAFTAWAGSIFRGDEWECVGYVQARHEKSHCRIVKKWKLRS